MSTTTHTFLELNKEETDAAIYLMKQGLACQDHFPLIYDKVIVKIQQYHNLLHETTHTWATT